MIQPKRDTIYPEIDIVFTMEDGVQTLNIATRLRFKDRKTERYYLTSICNVYIGEELHLAIRSFSLNIYSFQIMGEVDTRLSHNGIPIFELDTNQEPEETRLFNKYYKPIIEKNKYEYTGTSSSRLIESTGKEINKLNNNIS